MSVRTEQTLRRMWEESLKLADDAKQFSAEHQAAVEQATEHDRAAAAEKAAADACRTNAEVARNISERADAEAADLADMVNEKREQAGLPLLTPGDPYPADAVESPAVAQPAA